MNKITCRGKVVQSKLVLEDDVYFESQLGRFRNDVLITVEDHKPTRSREQNRYYWGVVLEMIAEQTGHKVEEIHEVLKYKFNPKQILFPADSNMLNKTQYEIYGGSTTELTTAQFVEYISAIRTWAYEFLGMDIPEPEL